MILDDSNRLNSPNQSCSLKLNSNSPGSGFTVKVTFIETNMAPLFRAVDHSNSNDNEALREDMKAFLEHCPYPVPEKYNLTLILHEVILNDDYDCLC